VCLFFAACQQTPDNEIVVNKDNGLFEQALAATQTENTGVDEAFSEMGDEYPDEWKAYYEKYNGKLKVTIDAEVSVGNAKEYSVSTIKPYYIPIEQANRGSVLKFRTAW
jgi:hypothetical protein